MSSSEMVRYDLHKGRKEMIIQDEEETNSTSLLYLAPYVTCIGSILSFIFYDVNIISFVIFLGSGMMIGNKVIGNQFGINIGSGNVTTQISGSSGSVYAQNISNCSIN